MAKTVEDSSQSKADGVTEGTTAESHDDQQIIDAMMDGDQTGQRPLALGGLSWKAVAVRGREMGITEAFIKECRLSGSRPAMRTCVSCDERFLSSGVHNRLCRRCRR